MRLFVDANIIVAVLNKEYPLFSNAARILSLAERTGFEVFTSPVCLAIAFYFAEKRNKATAKKKIDLLCQHIKTAPVTETCVSAALANKNVHDFEDGLEYYAALEKGCTCIVTEDTHDYYFSTIEVFNSKDFLQRLLR
jgi:predicted nucleic acid-binding protein